LTSYGGAFLNSSFGWPAFVSANTRNTGPAFFRAAPGVRLRVELVDGMQAQIAVYDGDTFDHRDGRQSGNPHGINFHLSDDQGALVMAEVGWERSDSTNHPALPGAYKLGAWFHTAQFDDLRVAGRSHPNNYGVYLAAEQMVWRESSESAQGLGVFFRLGVAPENRNFVAVACDGGLHYVGLWPGRDRDILALGVACIWASQDAREAERAAGAPILSDREVAFELAYQIQVKPWLSIEPDFQWIHHPGASGAIPDAVVLGARTRLTF
jgi:porin